MTKDDEKETVAELSGFSLCINNWGQIFLGTRSMSEETLREFFNENYPDLESVEEILESLREMNDVVMEMKGRWRESFMIPALMFVCIYGLSEAGFW